jgi:hypothetical protein
MTKLHDTSNLIALSPAERRRYERLALRLPVRFVYERAIQLLLH